MPIRRGSISCSRFLIEGEIPKDVKKWLTRAVGRKAFEPIDLKGDEERAAGFVEFGDSNATDFAGASLFEGEHAVFSWRVDKIRISGAAVRAAVEDFAKKYEAKNGRKPSRGQKAEQKDLIRKALRTKSEPSSKTFDVSIDLRSKHVLVWASSVKLVDEVYAALEEGLEAQLVARTPQAFLGVTALEKLAPTTQLFGGVS
ncbi:MAG: recombination-associated protein RdgC [Archangiaceae bacterium]|nr:recombination-associated protein RdgC [Archangiaceae bacterium]